MERDHRYCLPLLLRRPIHSADRLYDCRESILNLVSYSRYLRSEDRSSDGDPFRSERSNIGGAIKVQ